jgi:integral membrane sensor domain MASE1
MLTYITIYSSGVIIAFVLISALNHLWFRRDKDINLDLSEVLFLSMISWIGVGIIIVVPLVILIDHIQYKDNKIIKILKRITGVEK